MEFTPYKGSENRYCAVNGSGHIGQRRSGASRRPVGLSRYRHVAAVSLNDQIERRLLPQRPGFAESGDADGDDLGVDRLQRVVIDPKPDEHAGAEVVYDHIRLLDEAAHYVFALIALEVEDNALLASIHEQVNGAVVFIRGDVGVACSVAGVRFDLDDVGPEVGQDDATEVAGDHPTELEDGDPFEQRSHEIRSPS